MFADTDQYGALLDAEGLSMLTSSSKTNVGQVGQSSPTIYLSIGAARDTQARASSGAADCGFGIETVSALSMTEPQSM